MAHRETRGNSACTSRANRYLVLPLLVCGLVIVAETALCLSAHGMQLDARQVMENVMEAGSTLNDFRAHVSLKFSSGRLSGREFSGEAYVKKPNQVAFRILYVTVRPKDSMLFPDPMKFLNDNAYILSMAGVEEAGDGIEYVVKAEPRTPCRDVACWLFTIDDRQWLIRRAEVVLKDGSTSSLSADYAYVASEDCFVPSRMVGKGGAFVEEVFSVGLLRSLASWVVGSDVEYVVNLTGHEVNTGLRGSPLD